MSLFRNFAELVDAIAKVHETTTWRVGYARPMNLATLSATSLPDASGASHRLGDLWADQPVVLVFLRHFG